MLVKHPTRKQALIAWGIALVAILALGTLRTSTEAEFAFASAAIIPVFLVSWTGGFGQGAAVSVLAVVMWVLADIASGRDFAAAWVPWLNGAIRLATYVFVAYMTSKVKTLLEREVELATRDSLTGQLNRRAFFEAGETEAKRARRYGHPLAVIFLDLDNFKRLNDTRGHQAGDAALRATGVALQRALRSTDRIARLGGDEFAVLLPETGAAAAKEAGEKAALAVNGVLARYPPASASVGVACFETWDHGFPAMLHAADALMYEIKREGKRAVRVRTYSSPPSAAASA